MGKEIVRQSSPEEPGRRSRLWFSEDIIHVLQNNTGTSRIEIIHMDFALPEEEEIKWDRAAFKKMENLKTLIIRNGRFSKGPKHLPNSLRVLEWNGYPSKSLPSDFHPRKDAILKIVKLPNTYSRSSRLAMLLKTLLLAEMTWKLVGLASSAVGLSCYAVSPSFNRLIGGWNTFKFSLYGLLSLAICAIILFAKRSSPSGSHVHLKACMGFAVLMIISVYSFFYDRAVNGKPEILSLVSNGAFALMSLSLSRLIKFGFEMGVFCFFIGCLTIQLVTIDLKLILVAIIFGCPLFLIHSSSDSHEEVVGVGSQSIHPSSDSQPEIGNDVQHTLNIITM
ncbi:hypothetical protein VNO77_33329 [Canavalia gladiata]|uniref:Uncharacterized protein n=1 Tax=Canavalia gladiata TaxID=3824 RepID=A0AAN9KE61_CANGL